MATSFNGWGNSWGDSWGTVTVDPNAMSGTASFSFAAAGDLTDGATPEVTTTPRRHAGTKKPYLIKGQRYLLDDRELAVKISDMLTEVSKTDVQRITHGKKKQLSPQYWAAIEALISDKIFHQIEDEDDEEVLLMF